MSEEKSSNGKAPASRETAEDFAGFPGIVVRRHKAYTPEERPQAMTAARAALAQLGMDVQLGADPRVFIVIDVLLNHLEDPSRGLVSEGWLAKAFRDLVPFRSGVAETMFDLIEAAVEEGRRTGQWAAVACRLGYRYGRRLEPTRDQETGAFRPPSTWPEELVTRLKGYIVPRGKGQHEAGQFTAEDIAVWLTGAETIRKQITKARAARAKKKTTPKRI